MANVDGDCIIISDDEESPEIQSKASGCDKNQPALPLTSQEELDHWRQVLSYIENNPDEIRQQLRTYMVKELDRLYFNKNSNEKSIDHTDVTTTSQKSEEKLSSPISSQGSSQAGKIRPRRMPQHLFTTAYEMSQPVVIEDPDDEPIITAEIDCQEEKINPVGDHLVSFIKHGQVSHAPEPFRLHTCNDSCIYRDVDLKTLRGSNPYTWPILCGWRRRIYTREEFPWHPESKEVYYVTPCGRKLRSIDEVVLYIALTNCPLGIDLFTFDIEIEFFRPIIAVVHQCVTYVEDVSGGNECQPICLINFLNDKVLDPRFKYRSDRFPGPGVHNELDTNFSSCCDCEDNCQNPATCACQRLTSDAFNILPGLKEVAPVSGYKNKRLEESVPLGIYECNARCPCNSHCPNRVVQLGVRVLLQVFQTTKKGWGVRALHDIPKGTFISIYSAQILSEEKADESGYTAGDEYFANLDFLECFEQNKEHFEDAPQVDLTSESSEEEERGEHDETKEDFSGASDSDADFEVVQKARPRSKRGQQRQDKRQGLGPSKTKSTDDGNKTQQDEDMSSKSYREELFGNNRSYILDAKFEGNVGRFFNHSCNPNTFVQNIFVDNHDFRFPIVAFFTLRTIFAMEEITWNYNYEIDSVPGRRLECFCKSTNCRGRLL